MPKDLPAEPIHSDDMATIENMQRYGATILFRSLSAQRVRLDFGELESTEMPRLAGLIFYSGISQVA